MNISLCVLLVGTIGVITKTASECYEENSVLKNVPFSAICDDYSDCHSKCDKRPRCGVFGVCNTDSGPHWYYFDRNSPNLRTWSADGTYVYNCTSYVRTVNCTKVDDEEKIAIEVIDSDKTCREDANRCPLKFRLKYLNGTNLPEDKFETADVNKFEICKIVDDTRKFCIEAKYKTGKEIYVRRLLKNRKSKYGGTRNGTWVGVLLREKSGEMLTSDPITVTID